jgi:hypothetical protein
MRLLLAILSFLALALSPIAAPAASAAMAAQRSCDMVGMARHETGHSAPAPASAEPCCVAVAADVPVAMVLPEARPVTVVTPIASIPRVLGGAGPAFDDPPPKA